VSIWPHVHSAAAGAAGTDRDRFAAMVCDLLTVPVATGPVTILSGHLRDADPLSLIDVLAEYRNEREKAIEEGRPEPSPHILKDLNEDDRVEADLRYYHGEDLRAIRSVLDDAPVGSQDVAVVFHGGLCLPDGADFEYSDLALYATVEPVTLYADGLVYVMPDGRIFDERTPPPDDIIDETESHYTLKNNQARWFFYSYGRGGPFEFLPHAEAVLDRHLGADRVSGVWCT